MFEACNVGVVKRHLLRPDRWQRRGSRRQGHVLLAVLIHHLRSATSQLCRLQERRLPDRCTPHQSSLFWACWLPVGSIWPKSTDGGRLPHNPSPDRLTSPLETITSCARRSGHPNSNHFREGPLWVAEEGLEMTITVLLMTILTGVNHTVVAEYDTPQACEAAAQAHQKVLLESAITIVYSCSPKAGSR